MADSMDSRVPFPPLSDLSEYSFGINGPNVARISLNFECNQFLTLVGLGDNRVLLITMYIVGFKHQHFGMLC